MHALLHCVVCAVQMMGMLPGFNSDMLPKGNDKASQMVIKRFITIIESMTDKVCPCSCVRCLCGYVRCLCSYYITC